MVRTSDKWRKWIEAGRELARDSSAKVTCPVCGKGYLEVRDVPVQHRPVLDRYMTCPICRATNVITMHKKDT
jgi:transcription elongation factor Elf1